MALWVVKSRSAPSSDNPTEQAGQENPLEGDVAQEDFSMELDGPSLDDGTPPVGEDVPSQTQSGSSSSECETESEPEQENPNDPDFYLSDSAHPSEPNSAHPSEPNSAQHSGHVSRADSGGSIPQKAILSTMSVNLALKLKLLMITFSEALNVL